MKKIYILLTLFISTLIINAQCDPGLVNHYNMGDFPFISSSGVTVSMAGTNSGTLGPYGQYGCSPALCDANTIRLDPGDTLIINFSQIVYEFTFIAGVMNPNENGLITSNNGIPTLSSNCITDLLITGNAFEQIGVLASPVITVSIPNGATSISILSLPSTTGNGVFTVDMLDCINILPCNNTSNLIETACDSYNSPSGNYTWTTSGIYNDTIANTAGCDSVITINLTIDTVDNGIINNSPTLYANAITATYQWLDCDSSYMPILGAINQTFTASVNGNYAVVVTQNGCTDTSACVAVNNVGIDEISSNISLFPNPTNDFITLDIEGYNGSFNVEIYDLQGRLLETTKSKTVSLKKYSKGLYVFRVSYGDKTEEVRVLRD